jgi:hypothetical protein
MLDPMQVACCGAPGKSHEYHIVVGQPAERLLPANLSAAIQPTGAAVRNSKVSAGTDADRCGRVSNQLVR